MLDVAFAYASRLMFNVLYLPMRAFRVKEDKVSIFSRQGSSPSIDVRLLADELKRQNPALEIRIISKRDQGGLKGSIGMLGAYIKSLYHMATSKACVLESYWPPISVCKRRKGSSVIQMWHSIGKIKQSGVIATGRPGGRSKRLSEIMRMHKGYDFVIAGGKAWNRFYVESFDCDESILRNVGLPRIDHLVNDADATAKEVIEKYPSLSGKKVIMYAPTFRRGQHFSLDGILDALEGLSGDEYACIVKAHPNQDIDISKTSLFDCPDASAVDLLSVADYLITDYSAIALEAAAADVKTLYYIPDYDEYRKGTGLNIDLYEEVPDLAFDDAHKLRDAILGEYPANRFRAYKEKFLFDGIGSSAKAIADIIFDEAGVSR